MKCFMKVATVVLLVLVAAAPALACLGGADANANNCFAATKFEFMENICASNSPGPQNFAAFCAKTVQPSSVAACQAALLENFKPCGGEATLPCLSCPALATRAAKVICATPPR
jgi:hypothetical protein